MRFTHLVSLVVVAWAALGGASLAAAQQVPARWIVDPRPVVTLGGDDPAALLQTVTIAGLAEALGVSRQSINELLRARRAVSPEMALRLSCLFGNSPEFWLNAQRAVDLWDAAQTIKVEMGRIKPLRVA